MKVLVIQGAALEKLKRDLAEYVGNHHLDSIAKQGLVIAEPLLIEALIASFKRTKAWKGIAGEYSGDMNNDVQAHMGLTDVLASNALSDLENMLRYSIDVSNPSIVSRNISHSFASFANSASISFNISFKRLSDDIKSIESGSYISENSNKRQILIPWIAWLVDGWDDPSYRIEFGMEFGGSIDIGDKSRSGRAIMVYKGDYNTRDYHNFAEHEDGGKSNFIIDALSDEVWRQDAAMILRNSMQEAADVES